MTPWQNRMFKRHVAYRQCFLDDHGNLTAAAKVVLADIAKFASVMDPTVVSPVSRTVDVPATHQRIGRGEVLHRVWRFLHLPFNQLFEVQQENNDD